MENLAKALVGLAALSLVVGVIAAGPMGGDIMGFPAESFPEPAVTWHFVRLPSCSWEVRGKQPPQRPEKKLTT